MNLSARQPAAASREGERGGSNGRSRKLGEMDCHVVLLNKLRLRLAKTVGNASSVFRSGRDSQLPQTGLGLARYISR